MNCTYRSIWSDSTGTFVAVSEDAKCAGKKTSSCSSATGAGAGFALQALAISVALSFGGNAFAGPAGGVVAAGTASISTAAGSTTINQSTQNAAINWQSFNIAAGEAVHFVQPNSNSVTLNRVVGADPSSILGSMTANGKVFLVNPNGVLFGKGSSVNVGGLVASTLNITDSDFMAGNYKFSGTGNGVVLNQGAINADGGYVALLGANVGNDGVISAQLGTVALAAGNAITLDVAGDGLLNVSVNQGAVNALVQNGGLIRADGGQVLLTSRSASSLLPSAVNNTGVIQAQTLVTGEDGSIKLMGDMQSGTVNVGGTLDASAPNGGNGGFIETSAAHVKIANDARISTAAPKGLIGTWLIDPVDFNIEATGGDISGSTLAQMLVTNNVTISTVETGSNTATHLFAAPGQGDINVNDAIGTVATAWTATPNTTTLTLNAFRDVNVNAPITATNGNVVACCGRDVNVRAAITTTNGSVLLSGGRDVNLLQTGAITTTNGNITMCAGNDVIVNGKIVLTDFAKVSSQSLGLADGLVLSAGNDGTGPGAAGGTVTIAFRADPSTITDAPVTINYNPLSYTTPTDYSPATFFIRTRSLLTQHMLVFPDGGSKDYDGNTATTLSGLKGNPAGVTLVAGSGSTASFDTPDVGVGKTVTFDGYSLGGTNAGQYILPISCCAPVVARTTANINAVVVPPPVVVPPVVVPPVVVPPVVVPPEGETARDVLQPQLPYEAPIVNPRVTTPTWMPVVLPAATPPELLTLAPPVVPPVVVAPVLVVEQPPVIVAPQTPPEIYVAPKRARKQDRN